VRGRVSLELTDKGVQNFTDFLPSELNDMERLVQETAVVQKVPPVPEPAITASQGKR